MPFPKYENNKLVDGKFHYTLKMCIRYFHDETKKCKAFYKSIAKREKSSNLEYITCPYGLTCVLSNDLVYNSIIVNNNINKKTTGNLRRYDDGIENNTIFTKDTIEMILKKHNEFVFQVNLRDDALHDIRNIMKDMNDELYYLNAVLNDHQLRTIMGFSDLIKYRFQMLNEIYFDPLSFEKKSRQFIHPTIHKFKNMFETKMKKKDLSMYLPKHVQYNEFELSDEIYLAIFILIENAIKHSLPNTKIDIFFDETIENTTVLTIQNYTTFIGEDEVPKLRERGYRAKQTTTKGTGIGLTKAVDIFEKNNIKFSYFVQQCAEESIFSVKLVFVK